MGAFSSLPRGGASMAEFSGKPLRGSQVQHENKLDSDLAALEQLSDAQPEFSVKSTQLSVQQGTLKGDQFCATCGANFDEEEHRRLRCTNCIKEACSACIRQVRLESYGEKEPRPMCVPCVDDVKRKIINWKSVGRGTGSQAPPPGAHQRRGSISGVGRGRERSNSLGSTLGRGRGSPSSSGAN